MKRTPFFESKSARIYLGESLDMLNEMETDDGSRFDALITDPPYCSGAGTLAGRQDDPTIKYCHSGNAAGRATFSGDSRDPRSFLFWFTMWMSYGREHCKDRAYSLVFSDWRQMPMLTDVFQSAGWFWKGVAVWNKGRGSRAPHKGYFRHQSEFIVWGTNGKVQKLTDRGPFDGVHTFPVKQSDKHHMTGKPTPLFNELVKVAPVGGLVLDPFAGSGTTGVAAVLNDRRAVLFEQSEAYCEIAAKRLEAAERGELLASKPTASRAA